MRTYPGDDDDDDASSLSANIIGGGKLCVYVLISRFIGKVQHTRRRRRVNSIGIYKTGAGVVFSNNISIMWTNYINFKELLFDCYRDFKSVELARGYRKRLASIWIVEKKKLRKWKTQAFQRQLAAALRQHVVAHADRERKNLGRPRARAPVREREPRMFFSQNSRGRTERVYMPYHNIAR